MKENPDRALSLQEMIDEISTAAERIFNEQEYVPTAWLIQAPDHKLILVPTPWGDEPEKTTMIKGMRYAFNRLKIQRFVVVLEMWFAQERLTRKLDEQMLFSPTWPEVLPRDRPDRREGLLFHAASLDGETLYQYREILRNPPRLEPLSDMGLMHATSIFDTMFKRTVN